MTAAQSQLTLLTIDYLSISMCSLTSTSICNSRHPTSPAGPAAPT